MRDVFERERNPAERTFGKSRLNLSLRLFEEKRAETIEARLHGFDAKPDRLKQLERSDFTPGDELGESDRVVSVVLRGEARFRRARGAVQ